MKRHAYLGTALAAGALLFSGSLALAQTPTEAKKAPATTTTQPGSTSNGVATERQDQFPKASGARVDQFGHASGRQKVESVPATSPTNANPADTKSLDSAHASESAEKKHIAGVKYEDRTAAPTGAPSDEPSKMGINEQGVPSRPTPTVKPK